ncbi:MAG: FAD-dependent oxidoreductase [Candidatus Nomurabacteria bacterium]|nr:MAG: FAD-dependent oxidoreductase [Candidatus Nomurabacteria bacterium]
MAEVIDTIMIGAGPSSLAAAVYTTREDIKTVLYEKGVIGGLAAITDMVDNYPGFPEGIEGMKLADQLQKQAERFGAKIEFGQVDSLKVDGEIKNLVVDGQPVQAKTVLIATGSDYNKLGIPGEQELYGRGVHYCATCDGAFYREKRLVVVGGGNSAVQEAIFLTRFATHIDLLVRSTVKASDVLQQDLQKCVDEGKITIHLGVTPTEIVAGDDGKVTHVAAKKNEEDVKFETDGVFIFVGLKPNTQFLEGSGIELDEQGLIKTNEHLETNLPGVFASGDVRSGATMQIASAVGEGATAALSIREYLDNLHHVEVSSVTESPVAA